MPPHFALAAFVIGTLLGVFSYLIHGPSDNLLQYWIAALLTSLTLGILTVLGFSIPTEIILGVGAILLGDLFGRTLSNLRKTASVKY